MVLRFVAAAVVALLFSFSSPVHAQGCANCGVSGVAVPSNQHVAGWLHKAINGNPARTKVWRGPPPRYLAPEYYDQLNKRYPKFTGGFHSSYFHNMGFPQGDLGPRGNGIYPTPW